MTIVIIPKENKEEEKKEDYPKVEVTESGKYIFL